MRNISNTMRPCPGLTGTEDVKEVAGIASDVTSYTIRHSFAMALKEQNVPIEMISELLGHKSIKTTQIYLRSFSLEKMTVVNKSCFENVYNYMPEVGSGYLGSSVHFTVQM